MEKLHKVTFILLVVGGLNWLLFGLLGWDIGSYLPGGMTGTAAKVIYVLVGLSAINELFGHKKCCKMCGSNQTAGAPGMMPGMK